MLIRTEKVRRVFCGSDSNDEVLLADQNLNLEITSSDERIA